MEFASANDLGPHKRRSTRIVQAVPLAVTGVDALGRPFTERASTLITRNLPFDEWTELFGSERLTGALLDRITHHVHILEMNADSYRLKQSRRKRA